jgi:hypothetical protein
MRRPGDDTELDVAHRHVAAHVERERHRQQVFIVVPVEFDVHQQLPAPGAELVGDHAARRPEGASDPDASDQRAVVDDRHLHRVAVVRCPDR